MNMDCWLLVLRQIPPGERTQCRMVCRQWCNLIDYLSLRQKSLEFYSTQSNHKYNDSIQSNLFSWPHANICYYNEFVRIFQQYPNLRELVFSGFTHWNDHHLIRLTELCPSIESLSFYSCSHLGKFSWSICRTFFSLCQNFNFFV